MNDKTETQKNQTHCRWSHGDLLQWNDHEFSTAWEYSDFLILPELLFL